MDLSENQRRFLRGRAHALKPIIQIGGKGLTEAVAKETQRALQDHELIKVRATAADRVARDALIAELVARTNSALVQRIGHVAVLYRANDAKPGLIIPDPNA
ncbi:MAG TPA: ribosome assembly RNA-binding protein YhbY [Steroidobacteraceae bacterium]|jgi:RNA-binding protein|nr:ribosome assembly RNA-binding protein YhbY [Steroidobacteraceae bacterium]